MAELKFVISDPKTGRSYPKNLHADLIGKKIGDTVYGSEIGLSDFEFQITGGSDNAGFPHRKDILGAVRKRVLIGSGAGVRINKKGVKIRKTVRGNTLGNLTSQVNLKIIKQGKESIEKALGIEVKEESKVEESK